MRIRHRIPTIFNLSMVDVLCCALGCAILLWLLNLREAKERATLAGETSERLKAAQSDLDETTGLLLNTVRERDEVSARADAAAAERDRLQRDWQTARAQLVTLDKELATLRKQNSAAEERLAMLTQEQRNLTREKADTARRMASLETLIRDKETQAEASANRLDDLAAQVRAAEAKTKKLQDDLQDYRSKVAAAQSREEELELEASTRKKELAEASRNIDVLQQDKKSLADQASRARAAMENRFEGITLTGTRVLFLVDMSGSMELVDERTPDANKWVGVRETVAKIMRSLPDLEKFQVLVFAEQVSYLLGSDGRWIDYDARTSVDQVIKALAAIKPKGGTNMSDAFETAFRFRSAGLDTMYVLSDGLPNIGPGLPANQTNLSDDQRSVILAKYIRNLLRKDWNRVIRGRPRVRINTIGFFYESPDVGAFLWALARENDGSFVGMSKP